MILSTSFLEMYSSFRVSYRGTAFFFLLHILTLFIEHGPTFDNALLHTCFAKIPIDVFQ